MAIYHLKYRPGKIRDLDSESVRESMTKWLSETDPPRSFLFCGPKGSGKTSAARILAKSLNCLDKKEAEVCGKCANCLEIESGRSIDMVELDGASNRGIEDVRSIKDKAYLLPSKLDYKVIIIDEVHMLTKEAFNALLKLIEEPPVKTVFVMCTTDPQKIPQTVLSRLVRIDFKKGGSGELRQSLKRIIQGEEIKISKEAIDLIVSKSDGSFRNIARMFNEIVVSLGKKIDLNDLEKYFSNKGGDYSFDDLVIDLANKETKKVLVNFEKMAEKGMDFGGYRNELLNYLQKKLLAEYGLGGEKSVLSQAEISRLMNILISVGRYEKEVEIGQLPLEMAVVEYVSGLSGDPNVGRVNPSSSGAGPSNGGVTKKGEEKKNSKEGKLSKEEVGDESKMVILTQKVEDIEKKWHEVLAAVKPYNHSVEAFLRASRPKEVVKGELVMEVFYPFHKDKLEEPRNRQIVEVGLEKVLGEKILFRCVLATNKKPAVVIDNNYKLEETRQSNDGGEVSGGDIYDLAKEIFG